MIARILADLVLVLHLAFVLFIILGGLLGLRWRSVLYFHLPTLAWGVLVQCFFRCLPVDGLRELAAASGRGGGLRGWIY